MSYFSEVFEHRGRWLRSVNLDFWLDPKNPKGGAFAHLQFDIPAEKDDPRISEVYQLAHAVAREHLRRALALSERKISEDAFKDEISRASHHAAHDILSRAIDLTEQNESWRGMPPETAT